MYGQIHLKAVTGHCLSRTSLICCLSSFGSLFPLCQIKVGEGNAHRHQRNYQALGSLPRSHPVSSCNAPPQETAAHIPVTFLSSKLLFYQTTEMTNHLSAKWKWRQFSCKEWPLWFLVTSEWSAPTGQVPFCIHKHWIKDWKHLALKWATSNYSMFGIKP